MNGFTFVAILDALEDLGVLARQTDTEFEKGPASKARIRKLLVSACQGNLKLLVLPVCLPHCMLCLSVTD